MVCLTANMKIHERFDPKIPTEVYKKSLFCVANCTSYTAKGHTQFVLSLANVQYKYYGESQRKSFFCGLDLLTTSLVMTFCHDTQ